MEGGGYLRPNREKEKAARSEVFQRPGFTRARVATAFRFLPWLVSRVRLCEEGGEWEGVREGKDACAKVRVENGGEVLLRVGEGEGGRKTERGRKAENIHLREGVFIRTRNRDRVKK